MMLSLPAVERPGIRVTIKRTARSRSGSRTPGTARSRSGSRTSEACGSRPSTPGRSRSGDLPHAPSVTSSGSGRQRRQGARRDRKVHDQNQMIGEQDKDVSTEFEARFSHAEEKFVGWKRGCLGFGQKTPIIESANVFRTWTRTRFEKRSGEVVYSDWAPSQLVDTSSIYSSSTSLYGSVKNVHSGVASPRDSLGRSLSKDSRDSRDSLGRSLSRDSLGHRDSRDSLGRCHIVKGPTGPILKGPTRILDPSGQRSWSWTGKASYEYVDDEFLESTM